MMRKTAIALIAFYGAGTWGIANALGFGELKLHSALNEKLKAEIELHGVGDLSKNEIIPNIGNHEDFARANIKRLFFLTGIKFQVVYDSPENAILQLTTEHIVREPFLNFLVELHWPSGRLLREYTILLDPPAFAEKPLIPITSTQAKLTNQIQPILTIDNSSSVKKSPIKKIRVKKNDTLWSLARKNRPEKGLSIHQTMLAIQQKNPHAFINNNINMMMAGSSIKMPKANEIKNIATINAMDGANALNKSKAMPELKSNVKNKTTNSDASIASITRPLPTEISSPQPEDAQLKLVSDDAEQTVLAAGLANNSEDLEQTEITSNASSQGTMSYQNDTADTNSEINSQIASAEIIALQNQLEELEKKISLKDEQLAQLQVSLSSANKQKVLNNAKPNINNKNNEDNNLSAPSIYIGSLILFALTGLVIYNIISRRKKGDEQYPNDLQETLDNVQDNIKLDVMTEKDSVSETLIIDSSDASTNDVLDTNKYLEEADIYIAYSRYERAIEVLKPALDINPDNPSIQLKLAEIYIALGDAVKLDEQEHILKKLGDSESLVKLESLKADLQQDSNEIDSITSEELNEGTFTSTTDIEPLAELEFNLTDEPDASAHPASQQEPLDEFDLNLDDEIDITANEINDESSDTAVTLESLADLEFDLLNDEPNVASDELSNVPSEPLNELEFNLNDDQDVLEDNVLQNFDVDLPSSEDTNITASDTISVQPETSDFAELGITKNVMENMDFLEDDIDAVSTKLDLAAAYVEMDDLEAATELLEEVLIEGNEAQKDQAKKLLNFS